MRILFLTILLTFQVSFAKDYVSILCIFQNEAPYLKEWIDYHIKLGVDKFYLINNLSKDNPEQVLASYVESGTVELYYFNVDAGKEFLNLQNDQYDLIFKQIKDKTEWIAVIDTDEFIVPIKKRNLKNFLKDYEKNKIGAVYFFWQNYGTSNIEKIEPGQSMLKLLTKKAVWDHPENRYGKAITRSSAAVKVKTHLPILKKGYKIVTTSWQEVSPKAAIDIALINNLKPNIDEGRINHYWTRDEWYFWNIKVPRYKRWHVRENVYMAKYYDFNHIEDPILANDQ